MKTAETSRSAYNVRKQGAFDCRLPMLPYIVRCILKIDILCGPPFEMYPLGRGFMRKCLVSMENLSCYWWIL